MTLYPAKILVLPVLLLGLSACAAPQTEQRSQAEQSSQAGIKTESECLKAENPKRCEFEHLKAGGYPMDLRGGNSEFM